MISEVRRYLLLILVLIVLSMQIFTVSIVNSSNSGSIDVIEISSGYHSLLADNGCNRVYAYYGPLNGSYWEEYWENLSTPSNGLYYKPSHLGELENLAATIDNTLSGHFNGSYRGFQWLYHHLGNRNGDAVITGIVIYINPDASITPDDILSATRTLMVEHNITKLVIERAHSNADSRMINAFAEELYSLIDSIQANSSINSKTPSYLVTAVNTMNIEGYETYDIIPDTMMGIVILKFEQPLSQPTLEDLRHIAWWILNHTKTCNVPIAIATKLDEPIKTPQIGPGVDSVNQNNINPEEQYNIGVKQNNTDIDKTIKQNTQDEPILATIILVSAVLIGSAFLFLGSKMWKPYRGS